MRTTLTILTLVLGAVPLARAAAPSSRAAIAAVERASRSYIGPGAAAVVARTKTASRVLYASTNANELRLVTVSNKDGRMSDRSRNLYWNGMTGAARKQLQPKLGRYISNITLDTFSSGKLVNNKGAVKLTVYQADYPGSNAAVRDQYTVTVTPKGEFKNFRHTPGTRSYRY